MKFNILVITVLMLSLIIAMNAHAQDVVVKTYPINEISELIASGNLHIDITQSDNESLSIEAYPETMRRVTVDISGRRLTLGVKNSLLNFFNWFGFHDDVKVTLHIKQLTLLNLSAATQAYMGSYRGEMMNVIGSGAALVIASDLQVDHLKMNFSGAVKSTINKLNSQNIEVDLSGASELNVMEPSFAQQLSVTASGASSYRGKRLLAIDATASAKSASDVEIQASATLKVKAIEASSIDCYGAAVPSLESAGASRISVHSTFQ